MESLGERQHERQKEALSDVCRVDEYNEVFSMWKAQKVMPAGFEPASSKGDRSFQVIVSSDRFE